MNHCINYIVFFLLLLSLSCASKKRVIEFFPVTSCSEMKSCIKTEYNGVWRKLNSTNTKTNIDSVKFDNCLITFFYTNDSIENKCLSKFEDQHYYRYDEINRLEPVSFKFQNDTLLADFVSNLKWKDVDTTDLEIFVR